MNNVKFYLVGGAVRDELMGVKPKDLDYSVEAASYEAMKEAIIARGGQIYLENPEYVTLRAKVPDLGCADFVLCRKDGEYSDGRHPDSVVVGTLYDDLKRRDFTCNAIAKSEKGDIIDPFDGVRAIGKRELICVGDTTTKLAEDAIRILRAIRFSITKGFTLSDSIYDFFNNFNVEYFLRKISKERICEEINKCFAHDTLLTLQYLERYPGIKLAIFEDSKVKLQSTLKQLN